MRQLQVNASGLLKSCPTEAETTAVLAGSLDQFWGPIPPDMLSVPSSKPQVQAVYKPWVQGCGSTNVIEAQPHLGMRALLAQQFWAPNIVGMTAEHSCRAARHVHWDAADAHATLRHSSAEARRFCAGAAEGEWHHSSMQGQPSAVLLPGHCSRHTQHHGCERDSCSERQPPAHHRGGWLLGRARGHFRAGCRAGQHGTWNAACPRYELESMRSRNCQIPADLGFQGHTAVAELLQL